MSKTRASWLYNTRTLDRVGLYVKYFEMLRVDQISDEGLTTLLKVHQDNAWGRKFIGMEQHPHYDIITEVIKNAIADRRVINERTNN